MNNKSTVETGHVITVPLHDGSAQYETVKAEMRNVPGVLHASAAMSMPMGGFTSLGTIGEERVFIRQLVVDHEFVETLALELVEGRAFSRDFPADDTAAVVINETLAALLRAANDGRADTFGSPQEYQD